MQSKLKALPPIPFTVIGGFLGAGKTTLLNAILQTSSRVRYAVLVNDFGAINIDETLITNHDGQTLSLSNGCICCSLANGFIETLIDLMARREEFDHIIVEASGVAHPSRIMDCARLDPDLAQDAIVVLIDADGFKAHLIDPLIAEFFKAQIANADLILLNKIDLVQEEDRLEDIHTQLMQLCPNVPILSCDEHTFPVPAVLCTGASHSKASQPIDAPHMHFETLTLHQDQAIPQNAFQDFVAALPLHVLRGKGYVSLRSSNGEVETYLWHRVGNRMRLTATQTPSDKNAGSRDETQIVLIGTETLQSIQTLWHNTCMQIYSCDF